jgi:putative endonuclease
MPSNNTSPVFFYTYILQSLKDHQQYIGYTPDLRKRLEEHRNGNVFSTQPRLPIELIYYEACLHEADAKQRERYLKTTAGRRFLAKRLKNFHSDAVWHRVK